MKRGDEACDEVMGVLGATVSSLRQPGRGRRVIDAARRWRFAAPGGLPKAPLAEVIDGIASTQSRATPANCHFFDLPYAERFVLDVLVRHLDARRIFEFGTFRGSTTRLLAEAAGPGGDVHTIDLPVGSGLTEDEHLIGEVIDNLDADERSAMSDITFHRADARTFDFQPFRNSFDLVFVDASHRFPDVMTDSRNAMRIVRTGGVVVWDDYQAGEPGVVRALHDLSREYSLVNVRWTRLALWSNTA
jgi:predicted O-methyltransferase YrrM